MAAVNPKPKPGGNNAASVPDIADIQTKELLKNFIAAKPAPDSFVPGKGMADGGDIQLRPGLYTAKLVGPETWPTASETAMSASADQLEALARQNATANEEAKRQTDEVLQSYWRAGDGAEAAEEHYRREYNAHQHLVDVLVAGAGGLRRLSGDVRATKKLIREQHDLAHEEIEAYLKAGGPIVGVSAITQEHRALITGYATTLGEQVTRETQTLTNKFGAPESPPKENGGRGDDPLTGNSDPKGHSKPETGDGGSTSNGSGAGSGSMNGSPANPSRGDGNLTPAPSPATTPSPSRPSMPSLPSAPSGGSGGASPLSGAASGGMGGPMSGLLGGGPSGLANNVGSPASSAQGQTARAMQTALGGDFGRGLVAGANAAGAVPPSPPPQPVPQTPSSPLAAPMSSASPAAAPATVSTPAAGAPAVASPAGGGPVGAGSPAVGGPAGAPMTPYGSVLPPSGGAPGGVGPIAGGGPAGLSGGAPPAGPVGGGPGSTTGFVPVDRGRDPGPVPRNLARSDLEVARGVVADLAAASSVIHPGLDWAVGVARGGQGIPQYWIASNEGLGGYIPAGVFVPRSMPVIGDVDGGHWMGWCNPAETVVRAIRARGESVSAVATTFMSRSEMIDEDPAIRDVAVGVPPVPGGPDQAEASRHLQSRAHRLETVASGLFRELAAADRGVVDAYARHLTQQAVFSSGLPELSETAQAVARAVLSGDWPSTEEWSALRGEYSSARLMAGSQRPGVNGNWEKEQALAYQHDFMACQRLETLVCWERDSRADVVYAAWAAGVPTPSLALLKA